MAVSHVKHILNFTRYIKTVYKCLVEPLYHQKYMSLPFYPHLSPLEVYIYFCVTTD